MIENSFIRDNRVRDDTIRETGRLIYDAIARLDLLGTDEQVTRALSIVQVAIHALRQEQHFSPEEIYSRALQLSGLERE